MVYFDTYAGMSEEGVFALEGGISAVAVAFLQQAVLRMIPYAVPSVIFIILDLRWGIKAAKYRGERVSVSTAIRRSMNKVFGYICWLILASTMAVAFGREWLEWSVLGLVYVNELASIVGNYLETKGLEIDWKNVFRAGFKIGGQKAGVDTDGIDPVDFVRPVERPRNAKGQFVKKGGKK